ncbi:MAG TPA: hypothetical protein ENJ84_13400 [Gammaproteobacteria bacterium]|nr:hypothetical protein [Gammaproteobacteria bacterium]
MNNKKSVKKKLSINQQRFSTHIVINGREIKNPIIRFLVTLLAVVFFVAVVTVLLVILLPLFGIVLTITAWIAIAATIAFIITFFVSFRR